MMWRLLPRLSPYDHDHPSIKEASADPANLAVIKPVVDHCDRVAGKHFSASTREIETAICKGPVPLGRIEGRFHRFR
jgi:hypothetical protein